MIIKIEGVCFLSLWIRPYNYHVLSFYKKILMMASLPIFHGYPKAQISALITIQSIEILRFCLSRPYSSAKKNIIRLISEVLLMLILIIILIEALISEELAKNDPDTLPYNIYWFYVLGWVGFSFILLFNLGWFVIVIWSIIRSCFANNTKEMTEIRK